MCATWSAGGSAPWAAVAVGGIGSALVALGGFGVGAVPAALAGSWLHGAALGRGLSFGLVLCGVALLLGSWWRLRGASCRVVGAAAGVWTLPLLVTPPLFSRDVYAYAGQAHLVALGLDPYLHGPSAAPGALAAEIDDVWIDTRSPYGPVFLRVASWVVPGQHVIAAVLLLRLLAVVGLALLAWALRRLATDPSRALWLAVANPLVLLHGVGGAHNDLLMAGLMMAGLAVAARRPGLGPLAAGAALVVAAALVKAPAVAALGFLPFLQPGLRLRRFVTVGLAGATTAVLLTWASGLGWGWLHTLGAGTARRSLLSISTGVGVLASTVAGSGAVTAAHAVGLLLAVAVGAVLLMRAPRVGALLALGLTLLAVVVLGPVVQPWYLLWALAPLAAVARERLAIGLAVGSAVLCLLILPTGRHLIRPPLYGVPAALAIAVGYAATRRAASTAEMVATT